MISSSYMRKIETWAEAYDQEAVVMSPEEFEALYDEAFFEAMELEKVLVKERRMNCPKCGCDIDEHPANRCLDAWVAEAILGCAVDWFTLPPNDFASPFCTCEEQDHEQDCSTLAGLLARYSIDIAVVWKIVEKHHEKELYVELWCDVGQWAAMFWYDSEDELGTPRLVGRAGADIAPLAICRAALKAWLAGLGSTG